MIIDSKDEHDETPSRLVTLFEGYFGVLAPMNWTLIIETIDPSRFFSTASFAGTTHEGKSLEVVLSNHATKKGIDCLPKTPREWAYTHFPAATVENQLEMLYESEEIYGAKKWYCVTNMWVDFPDTIIKKEVWSHLANPAHQIIFTGLTTKEDKPTMRFFASNIKQLVPLSKMS